MRPSLSIRSTAAVALLLAALFAGAASCATSEAGPARHPANLEEAVRRTLASGSARLRAQIHHRGAGTVTVTGVTSLREPASTMVAEVAGSAPVEVRVNADGAWLRASAGRPWVPVDRASIEVAGAAQGWGDVLRELRPDGRRPPRHGGIRATLDGAAATVWTDVDGRIRRIVADRRDATLDVRLSDHGLPVEVHAP